MDLGISGVGFSGFDRYSMNGYESMPNTAGSGSLSPVGSNGATDSGTAQSMAGPAIVLDFKQPGSTSGGKVNTGTYGVKDAKALKQTSPAECQTCKNRTYQDGSNDPGVSFKAPGHIDPASSAAVVMSHEQEHVVNERANAVSSGRRVVSQSVTLSTAVCPECGRVYVSGGQTRTVTSVDTNKLKADAYRARSNSNGQHFNMAV